MYGETTITLSMYLFTNQIMVRQLALATYFPRIYLLTYDVDFVHYSSRLSGESIVIISWMTLSPLMHAEYKL